jgi:hypothetical protein
LELLVLLVFKSARTGEDVCWHHSLFVEAWLRKRSVKDMMQ